MKRVFSGIQPSGDLHIGNYIGAVRQWVANQDNAHNIFCVVDLHAITVPQDAKTLRQKIREIAAIYLAAGIDPEKSTIFVQSHISQHAELGWILNCYIPMGWMSRMTQFKEKSVDKKDSVSVGLFDYPALMAADILLYDTDEVPVGEDQKQHVELTRDVAQKLNQQYGDILKVPNPVIPKTGARIMSLGEPLKKMSKSDDNKNNAIFLLDKPADAKAKIMKATTDSGTTIEYDRSRPGIYNLITIYSALSGLTPVQIVEKYQGQSYATFKNDLGDIVANLLTDFQAKYKAIMADPAKLDKILADGADKIRPTAAATLKRVQDKIGLG